MDEESIENAAAPVALSWDQAQFLLEASGPAGWAIFLLSIVALAVILMKIWQFARLRVGKYGFVDEALERWRHGTPKQALAVLARTRSPVARVMEVAIRGRGHRGVSEETVREEVTRVATGHLENLRSHLRILEVVASLGPLLGLLGTVMGMIKAFQQLELAGSRVDPAVLSGGIWEALLTTAEGLIVGIPAVIALHWFERRVDRLRHVTEDAATRIFTTELAPSEPSSHEEEDPVPLRRTAPA